jgi:uncharacterized membrane protein YhhN
MRASTLLWLAAVALSAGMAIIAAAREDRAGYALFKPLTTFIVLLGAAWLIRPTPALYRGLILLGLALSLAGDILLLPANRFIAGLVAFLLAHLAYAAAFTIGSPVATGQIVWLLPFAALGAAVLSALWRGLGRHRVPFAIYAIAIALMAWRAAMRGQVPAVPAGSFRLGLAGACLFLVSDAVLAARRFGRAFPLAQPVELATYWAAQTLIAMSVRMALP